MKFLQAVHITEEVRDTYIRLLAHMNIEHYIAPYEADAQLAYLYKTNRAQVIITLDSDLMVFGAERCFFKMDSFGYGDEIDLGNLKKVKELNFKKFDGNMFMNMAILSGCDYLDNIPKLGIKTAYKYVSE